MTTKSKMTTMRNVYEYDESKLIIETKKKKRLQKLKSHKNYQEGPSSSTVESLLNNQKESSLSKLLVPISDITLIQPLIQSTGNMIEENISVDIIGGKSSLKRSTITTSPWTKYPLRSRPASLPPPITATIINLDEDNSFICHNEIVERSMSSLHKKNELLLAQLDSKDKELSKLMNIIENGKTDNAAQLQIFKKERSLDEENQVIDFKSFTQRNHSSLGGMDLENELKLLKDQIEELKNRNSELTQQFTDDRKTLSLEYVKKIDNVESAGRRQIAELKSRIQQLHDENFLKQEELNTTLLKLHITQDVNKQLQQSHDELLKSTQEIFNHRQTENTFPTPMNMEINSSDINITATELLTDRLSMMSLSSSNLQENNVRIIEAKMESKLKKFGNKIQFLKSQLVNEQKLVEEQKLTLSQANSEITELKHKLRIRSDEQEKQRLEIVEETEKRIEMIHDEKVTEINNLQSKLLTSELQLLEMKQTIALTKQKEESIKNSLVKTQAQNESLRTELESLRSQVANLKNIIDKNISTTEGVSSNDNVLRKLENERQYLKNQLSAEVIFKNELQQALIQSQKQVTDAQREWQTEIENMKAINTSLKSQLIASEKLHTSKLFELESEKSRLETHTTKLKENYVKIREQMKNHQLKSEDGQELIFRLENQIVELKIELRDVRELCNNDKNQYRQKIDNLETILRETDIESNKKINDLKCSLSAVEDSNGVLKLQLEEAHNILRCNKEEYRKKLAAYKILEILYRRSNKKLNSCFKSWILHITLSGVIKSFLEQQNEIDKSWKTRLDEEIQNATETLRAQLEETFNTQVNETYQSYDDQIFQMKSDYIFQKANFEKDLMIREKNLIEDRDKEWVQKHENLENKYNEMMIALKQDLHDCKKKLESQEFIASAQHTTDLSDAKKEQEVNEIVSRVRKDERDIWINKIEILEKDYKEKCESKISNLEKSALIKFESLLKSAKAKWKKKLADKELESKSQLEALELKYAKELSKINSNHAEEIIKIRNERSKEHQAALEHMKLASEKVLSEIQQKHFEDMSNQVKVSQQDTELMVTAKYESAIKDLILQHQSELKDFQSDTSKAIERERLTVMESESNRWKIVLKDIEQSYELTIRNLRSEARAERESSLQSQQTCLEIHNKEVVENVLNESKRQLEQIKSSYEEQIAIQKELFEKEKMFISKDVEVKSQEAVREGLKAKYTEDLYKIQQAEEKKWFAKIEEIRLNYDKQILQTISQKSKVEDSLHVSTCENENLRSNLNDISKRHTILQSEYDLYREQVKHQHIKEKELLVKEHVLKHQSTITKLEKSYQDITLESIQTIKKEMTDIHNQKMLELVSQHEIVVNTLQESITNLKNETENLKIQLQDISILLENSQDHLFDLSEEMKRKQVSSSIMTWQLLSKVYRERVTHKKNIDGLSKQWLREKSLLEKTQDQELNQTHLIISQLTDIIRESDKQSKSIFHILMSHKSDDIAEKRNLVRNLRTQLNELSQQIGALEDQKLSKEEDLEICVNQIRVLEEEVRELHTREPLVQNGRLNQSHGKKKKRLDDDIERMTDSIASKEEYIRNIDIKIRELQTKQYEKDSILLEAERNVMEILVDQQRIILKIISENKQLEEQSKELLLSNGFNIPTLQ